MIRGKTVPAAQTSCISNTCQNVTAAAAPASMELAVIAMTAMQLPRTVSGRHAALSHADKLPDLDNEAADEAGTPMSTSQGRIR